MEINNYEQMIIPTLKNLAREVYEDTLGLINLS